MTSYLFAICVFLTCTEKLLKNLAKSCARKNGNYEGVTDGVTIIWEESAMFDKRGVTGREG